MPKTIAFLFTEFPVDLPDYYSFSGKFADICVV